MADTLTFAVPVEWSKSATYEQNIIVFVGKRAYTSLKAVPSGVEITDTSYWAETGVPTASEVSALRTRMDDAESSIAHLTGRLPIYYYTDVPSESSITEKPQIAVIKGGAVYLIE